MRLVIKSFSILISTSSCVSFGGLTARGTAALAPHAEVSMRRESNLDAFRAGAPAGMQMLEASLAASPDNPDILQALAKGYNAYAVAVAETDLLVAQANSDKFETSRDLAINYHTRAAGKARQYLEVSGIHWSTDPEILTSGLKSHSSDQNIINIAFIMSHSMKSLVSLQRGKSVALTYVPIADALSSFACAGHRKPAYPLWACEVMTAIELAEKPAVAGGDIQKSMDILSSLSKSPVGDLMPLALMAQFVLTKKFDKDKWTAVIQAKRARQTASFDLQKSIFMSAEQPRPDDNALLNAAAIRRIEILEQHEKDFF